MKREDFIFCIGFGHNTVFVDKKNRKKYARLDCRGLFNAGLYKPAFCAALYADDQGDLEWFREEYSKILQRPLLSIEDIKRIFGVFAVPNSTTHVIRL